MVPNFRVVGAALTLLLSLSAANVVVLPNDNRVAAGQMHGDTLRLRLVVQMAAWRPERDDGPLIDVAAFGEEGEAPRIPAPMIRVREGAIIDATVRNTLDSNVVLFGLTTHPVKRDSIIIRPGETRRVVFPSGPVGTYMYRARLGIARKDIENTQLGGAFIVDPKTGSPPDRVFVINIWGHDIDSANFTNALAINGRSWPATERIDALVGDTLRWRIVNASGRDHPMHLHGAYFRVDSKGGMFADTTYAAAQRRLEVTEQLLHAQTMTMVWTPVNPGRWLFHCHLMFHVIAGAASIVQSGMDMHDEHSMDPTEHMAGLVLGIDAHARPGVMQAGRARPRQLDLYVQEGAKRARAPKSMSFILQQGAKAPAPDSVSLPGSVIVLKRNEPTDVTIHNRMPHPTSVHWHGLELESYSDGVAGWGGTAKVSSPAVQPGGTFTAHLTMPRAGTFMYHTHLRDQEQLTSGLYGAVIVMEPGKKFDPRTDHVHVYGWDSADSTQALVNGDSTTSPPIEMRVGETHRFRFINIGAADTADFTIRRDTSLVEWRPVAKDGADLPAAQRVMRPAKLIIDVGETFDFEFTPRTAGEYVLSAPNGAPPRIWQRKIIVRAAALK